MPIASEKYEAAAEEYEKNSDLKREDLIRLRQWLATQKHLPDVTDEMLILFHHSCYYDLVRTKDCIEAYYTIRTNTPEFFTNRDVTSPELVKALEVMYIAILPVTDPRGNRMIYTRLRDLDPAKLVITDCNKLMLMAMDACCAQFGPMAGQVMIMDMEGTRLGHLPKLSMQVLRKMILYNQDANPVRLKEFHLINVVSWIDTLLNLLQRFMKKELFNSFRIHTHDLESLYKFLPKECLPADIGGTLDSVDLLHAETTKQLASMSDFFMEEEKLRVDESKREKKKKKKDTELATMLKNIEID